MLLIVVVVGIAAYFLLRSPSGSNAGAKSLAGNSNPDLPSKSLNPALVKNQGNVLVWEFLAPNLSTACAFARSHSGVRKKASECIALPLPDCGSGNCACHYRPVFESRKSHRRQGLERRGSLRFDGSEDRRKLKDRRKEGKLWDDNSDI